MTRHKTRQNEKHSDNNVKFSPMRNFVVLTEDKNHQNVKFSLYNKVKLTIEKRFHITT